jgi:Recombination endonuclease VII
MQRGHIVKHRGSWRLRFYDHRITGGLKARQRSVFLGRIKDFPSAESVRPVADKILIPANTTHATIMRNKVYKPEVLFPTSISPGRKKQEYRAEKLKSQGHRCTICGTTKPGRRGWHFDHDHETGAERDMLCAPCNLALGFVRDDEGILLEMVLYVRRHRAKMIPTTL